MHQKQVVMQAKIAASSGSFRRRCSLKRIMISVVNGARWGLLAETGASLMAPSMQRLRLSGLIVHA